MRKKASRSTELTFFCQEFRISLQFCKKGLIRGTLTHYYKGNLECTKRFDGLYYEENNELELAFFTEWSDPNLATTALTCFSGRTFTYIGDLRFLILKWLQINEGHGKFVSSVQWDRQVLVNSSEIATNSKLTKILSQIPNELFD